jgi:hypothetical protein
MHLPANTFSARHESRGEQTGTSTGTTLTAAASVDTKGSWTALGAATGFAYEGITVHLANNNGTNGYLVDIGIDDGSGNNFVLVPDLSFQCNQASEHNLALFIPVHIPAGSLMEARVACSAASGTLNCLVVGHSANPGGFPGYSRVERLFTPATSRGPAIEPGGTINTKGAWTQMVASTAVDIAGLFGVVGFNGDRSRAAAAGMLLDIGIGAASSEFVLVPNLALEWEATWDGPNDVFFSPVPAEVPSGTRVAARGQCSLNTAGDRTVDLALYGLVP